MNREERETRSLSLSKEEEALRKLIAAYEAATEKLRHMVEVLMLETDDPRVVYQVEYQESLRAKISAILAEMESENEGSANDFLVLAAEIAFVGTLYSLWKQGFDGDVAYDPITTSTALKRLQINTEQLASNLQSEISRGLASGSSFDEIVQGVSDTMKVSRNKAQMIVANEGTRLSEINNLEAMYAARDKGAEVMKEWSAILDNRVRPDHVTLHGQRVPLDEAFVLHSEDGNTYTAMYPHGFGVAKEDINCRCTIVPRLGNSAVRDADADFSAYRTAFLAGGLALLGLGIISTDQS